MNIRTLGRKNATKGQVKDKQKPQQGDENSEGEEMSDTISLVEEEDVEVEDAGEASKSDEKTNEDIMKAIFSLKSGLYKKIDVVQLTITEVKKQVQECTGRITHAFHKRLFKKRGEVKFSWQHGAMGGAGGRAGFPFLFFFFLCLFVAIRGRTLILPQDPN